MVQWGQSDALDCFQFVANYGHIYQLALNQAQCGTEMSRELRTSR